MESNGLQPTILGCDVVKPIPDRLMEHLISEQSQNVSTCCHVAQDAFSLNSSILRIHIFRHQANWQHINILAPLNFEMCCAKRCKDTHKLDMVPRRKPQDRTTFVFVATTALARHGEERRKLNPSCRTRTHTHPHPHSLTLTWDSGQT